jgi:hypothetical protein
MFSLALCVLALASAGDDARANAIASAIAAFGFIWLLVCLGLLILGIVVNWQIAEKAGFSGAMSLLMLIPLVNFIVLLVFAFTEWPIQRQLREAQSRGAQT